MGYSVLIVVLCRKEKEKKKKREKENVHEITSQPNGGKGAIAKLPYPLVSRGEHLANANWVIADSEVVGKGFLFDLFSRDALKVWVGEGAWRRWRSTTEGAQRPQQ